MSDLALSAVTAMRLYRIVSLGRLDCHGRVLVSQPGLHIMFLQARLQHISTALSRVDLACQYA